MIETKVEGDPTAVRGAGTFLRQTLKTAAGDAGDDCVAARRLASSRWEGGASEAYGEFAGKLVQAADEQEKHAGKAARAFDDYAGRLERFQRRMVARRTRASEGDLVLSGTRITPPQTAVPPPDLPAGSTEAEGQAWDRDNADFEKQKAKVELYNELNDEVTRDWETFQDYIDTELKTFSSTIDEPSLASALKDALEKIPAAGVAFVFEFHTRHLRQYAKESRVESRRLARLAEETRAARRSGNPARRAPAKVSDLPEMRRGARAADAAAEGAERMARRIPLLGTAISVATVTEGIASGDSPGRVISSEVVGTAAAVVGGAVLVTAGAPVLVVAGGAVVIGVGASMLAEHAWDNWVPDSAKEAIDDGLEDFGEGVKDVASKLNPFD